MNDLITINDKNYLCKTLTGKRNIETKKRKLPWF